MGHKSTLLVAFLIVGAILIAILAYPVWLNVGGFQRTLDADYVPTAEYMMQNPLPTPQFIGNITPPIGSKIAANQKICAAILPGALSSAGDSSGEISENVASNLRVVINMQVIPVEATQVQMISVLRSLSDGRPSGQVDVCFDGDFLNSGLHIFQIEMRNSPLGAFGLGELFSYTWAYQVEAAQ